MAKISALVSSAIGFDESRGDKLEVVNMRFVSSEEEQMVAETPDLLFGMAREDWFRMVEMIVMAVVAALVLLLFVRPQLRPPLEGSTPTLPAAHPLASLLPTP